MRAFLYKAAHAYYLTRKHVLDDFRVFYDAVFLNSIEVRMTKHDEPNVGRMPELTDFGMIYSARGRLLVLDLVMKDSLTGYIENPKAFPNLAISIRADMARELARELLRCADEIDAGRHHPDITILE